MSQYESSMNRNAAVIRSIVQQKNFPDEFTAF
jgi:hypothetical protein